MKNNNIHLNRNPSPSISFTSIIHFFQALSCTNNCRHSGVRTYLLYNFRCGRLRSLESSTSDLSWLKLTFNTSIKLVCIVYHIPYDESFSDLIDYCSQTLDVSVSNHLKSDVILLGNLNVHNKGWLVSSKMDQKWMEMDCSCAHILSLCPRTQILCTPFIFNN